MQFLPKSSQHARSHEFTKKNLILYQDNSLAKATRLKSLTNCSGEAFKNKEKFLLNEILRKKTTKSKILTNRRLKDIVNTSLKAIKQAQAKEAYCATLIQKNFRGFITRKHYSSEIEKLYKLKAAHRVADMHSMIYSMWIDLKYFIQVRFNQPVRVIETHYCRYKKRKQLLEIIEHYSRYKYEKRVERLNIISYIRVVALRNRLWEMKRPGYVKRVLEEIKERISLRKIQRFWRKYSINPEKILAKVRRFRRLHGNAGKGRRRSVFDQKIMSRHIWTFSMVLLPIVYNEKILLGAWKAEKREKKREVSRFKRRNQSPLLNNRFLRREIKEEHSQPSMKLPTMKFPTISSTRQIMSRVDTRASTNSRPQIEKITFSSPCAQSLGFKSFQFKVWKPLSLLSSIYKSQTPNPKPVQSQKLPSPLRRFTPQPFT